MVGFRLKQIGSALCLVASLLVGFASAGMCSGSQETTRFSDESVDAVKRSSESAAIDVDCGCCSVNVSSPTILVKRDTKELRAHENISNSDQVMPDPEFLVVPTTQAPRPEYAGNFSYSTDYQAYRPSRAPPRL